MKPDLKRASWLELFYDVAFVALVAQLTYLAYEHHHSVKDFLHIFIIGYTIFIAWWITTANRNLQSEEQTADKILVQLQMIGAFLMSLTMGPVFTGSYMGFFLALGLLRLLQSMMVLRLYLKYPGTRPKTYNMIEGFVAASLLWLVTAFVPDPFHFIIAFVALGIDIFTPLTKGKGNTKRYLNVFHLQERLGLFLMLVIGESMIVVALANTATSVTFVEPSIIFSGIGMMVALWWLYFEHSDERPGVRPKNLFLFLHSHGFLFGSIILLSVGYKIAISHPESITAAYFVAFGSFGVLATIFIIRLMMHVPVISLIRSSALFFIAMFLGSAYFISIAQPVSLVVFLTILYICAAVYDRKLAYKRGPIDVTKMPS